MIWLLVITIIINDKRRERPFMTHIIIIMTLFHSALDETTV